MCTNAACKAGHCQKSDYDITRRKPHLDLTRAADGLSIPFDLRPPPHLQPHSCIETQRIATCCHLAAAKYDADLGPNLVDEDDASFRLGQGGCACAHAVLAAAAAAIV